MVLHFPENSPFINDISQLCNIKGSILERDSTSSYNKKYYDEKLIQSTQFTLALLKPLQGNKTIIPEPFSKDIYIASNDFRCHLSTFTEFCKETGILFWLSIILIFLIIVISVSGKIKENYRWFIFNQVIFDLSMCYYNFCNNTDAFSYGDGNRYYQNWCPSKLDAKTILQNGQSASFSVQLYSIWYNFSQHQIYLPLFLLSGSRFVCLFFPHFYERTTKGWKLFAWIFGFDFIFVVFSALIPIILVLNNNPMIYGDKNYAPILNGIEAINYLKAYICLIPSIFFILAVIIKIIKHSKYQFRHNRSNFYSTIRIAAVMVLQLLINFLILFIETANSGYSLIIRIEYALQIQIIKAYNGQPPVFIDFTNGPFYWLDNNWGLGSTKNYAMLKEFRIVFESFVILFIMTGYREAIINFIKVLVFRKKQLSQTPLQSSTTMVETFNSNRR